MGKILSKGLVLKNKNFDTHPTWIEHFNQIKCHLKDGWTKKIRKNDLYDADGILDYYEMEMCRNLHKYYADQLRPIEKEQVIWRKQHPCSVTQNLLSMREDNREEHLKHCDVCHRVYYKFKESIGNLHLGQPLNMYGILVSIQSDYIQKLNAIHDEISQTLSNDMLHATKLINFLISECYQPVSYIPDDLAKQNIALQSDPYKMMTIGNLYRMLYDASVYNEAEQSFNKLLAENKKEQTEEQK